jgi:ATP-dependent Clp protease protease subunit
MSITLPVRPKALAFKVETVADPVFNVQSSTDEGQISIFDYIGAEVNSSRIAGALRSIGDKPITVRINSPGGDYFEGVSIYNILRSHTKPISVEVLGIAASAASVIAMAADQGRLKIAKNGQLMIHQAHGMVIGNATDMLHVADILAKIDLDLAGVYAVRSGLPLSQVVSMMEQETFLNSSDALALGLADGLLDRDAEPAPVALSELRPANRGDLERRLHAVGFPRVAAERIAAHGWPGLAGDLPAPALAALAELFSSHPARLRAALAGA